MKKILFIFVLSLYSIQGYASSCPDGSEPVRSISEDGTYFVFNCSTTDLIKKQGGDGYDSFPVHEFAKSPLRDLEVQENWQLFKDPDELDLFHSRFKYAIDEKGPLRWWKMSSYVDDCERATAEFDIEAFKSIEETGDRATFFIRCKTFFTHKHFRDQDEGIKVFERILLLWAKNKPKDNQNKKIKNSHSDIAYAATMTVGDFASFYAIYYDDFNFNKEQRQAVDDYLSDWLINYDLEPNLHYRRCVLEEPERFEIEGYEAFGIYADYCGSNRWRMGLGAVYLGLRTGNQRLFTAGNRHIEINLASIDKDGIFPQWSRKGALALSYQRQLPEVLTLLALAYESIGYDFYEHQLPHGKKIHEVYEALFDFIYHPEKLNKYAFARWDFVGKNAYEFDKLTLKEKWRREYIYPEVLASQSKGYVLRYRPDLMGDIDYSENWKEYGSDYVGVFVSISGLAIYEAVHQNISKIELEIAKKAEEKTDFCKESVDGLNTATWFAASTKDDVGWEFVGTEKISFDGCKGQFEAAEDFQPEDWLMISKELRRELNVNINPDGSINISGDLDLDYSETQRININGKISSGEVLGYFNTGWELKVELKKK